MATTSDTLTDGLSVGDSTPTITFNPGAFVNEGVSFLDLFSQTKWAAGASIADQVLVGDEPSRFGRFKISRADVIKISDNLARAIQQALTDGVLVGQFEQLTLGVTLLSKILMGEDLSSDAVYGLAIAETLAVDDVLQWFYGAFITETVAMHSTIAPAWLRTALAVDGILASDVVNPVLQVFLQLEDGIDVGDDEAMAMIYNATVEDSIAFTMGLLQPSGAFTAWAVNTRTSAVTEYANFAFNSFAQMGNHFLGANSGGLYVLDGALDSDESIVARVKSGFSQFSGSRFTALDAAYLGCRVDESGRTWLLKIFTGEGQEYVYKFRPLNKRTSKVFMGKGIRARYIGWELTTAGEDFDLDSIEFVPIGSKRRT